MGKSSTAAQELQAAREKAASDLKASKDAMTSRQELITPGWQTVQEIKEAAAKKRR